jgi:hypothetical protein
VEVKWKEKSSEGQPGARSSAPVCAGSGEDHFGSYVRSLPCISAGGCFQDFESMTSWSQGNSFTAAPGLPFQVNHV